MTVVGTLLAGLLSPILGVYFDTHRKKIPWQILIMTTVTGMLFMGIIAKNGVWIFAVIAGTLTVISSECSIVCTLTKHILIHTGRA